MRTARLVSSGKIELFQEPDPTPGPGEALVRVTSVGVCGSDLHWFGQAGIGDARLSAPLILGHEFAGLVESGPRLGARVAVDPAIPCGSCELCLLGHPNLCEAVRFAGHGSQDGALCELIAWPERCLFPLPDKISNDEGAMLEPFGVALHAVNLAHLKPGISVGVNGCGPIGLLILQLCRLFGASQVLATDPLEHRRAAALAMGADAAWPAGGEESSQILAATRKRGVDVAFEVAGNDSAIATAMTTVRPGGKVILVGIPDEDHSAFTASTARRKGLTIKMVRRMKFSYPTAIRLVETGQIDVRSLISHHFPLEASQAAFVSAASRAGLKVMVHPWDLNNS